MTKYEKLLSVQSRLKAPKSQRNDFGKYNYRNCEDILEAVKPILAEIKAVIILRDELVMIGSRYYVKATATFIDAETGEAVENTAFAREEETKKGMDGSQITGASSSYARKYALNGLLAIDDTKDSDTTNTGTRIICECCKKPVVGVKSFTAESIAEKTKQTYGKILCWTCAAKMKGESENA